MAANPIFSNPGHNRNPKHLPGNPRNQQQRAGFSGNGGVGKEDVVATRGVKIKSKSAQYAEVEKTEREEYKRRFEERAEETIVHRNEQEGQIIETITRFLKVSDDKTLTSNRGHIAVDVEREIRQDLLEVAQEMNNDETVLDNGKGSIVAISVLTKVLMSYRDRLNQLEYELHQIKREQARQKTSSQPKQGPSNADQ